MRKWLKKFRQNRGDSVLVTVVIAMPLLLATFAFATGISMNLWQKQNFVSAAQEAATASLQAVDTDGYLDESSINRFVSEYLEQTGRIGDISKNESLAATESSGLSCQTAEVDGVERELPYMEIQLDINREEASSSISTYSYTHEGTEDTAASAPAGGHGTVVSGQQYRVISVTVYEASNNITLFGYSTPFTSYAPGSCQTYSVDVSAILFGYNNDLTNG